MKRNEKSLISLLVEPIEMMILYHSSDRKWMPRVEKAGDGSLLCSKTDYAFESIEINSIM
jgi:hypothetical protein